MRTIHIILFALVLMSFSCNNNHSDTGRWTEERINRWYIEQGWMVGANYIPSSAINPIEMWQAETFDTVAIQRELHWASSLGFNTMRVFLHNLVWEKDGEEYLQRIDKYLEISQHYGIKTMFVLFDAVWNPSAKIGMQPEPVIHRHNSQWVQCPDVNQLKDTLNYGKLENYIKTVLSRFKDDGRVVIWDLYNEPDNDNFGKFPENELTDKRDYTYFLLENCFAWAREINPSQPITSGVWWGSWEESKLDENRFNAFQLENSDLISFHNYAGIEEFTYRIETLKRYNRPLFCTEYMARPMKNTFEAMMPVLKEHRISAYNWGFVEGRSQTNYPWDSWDSVYVSEPTVWFHDVLRRDGTPYSSGEVNFLKSILSDK